MSQVPIKNPGKTIIHVANVLIPPGETKVFDEADLPPHLKPARAPAPLPTQPDDPLLELLDESVSTIVQAIEERDEHGQPVLSDDQIIRLGEAEANGKTRTTLMKALDAERMKRAEEAQAREDLAVFAESLKEMGDEQLAELAKTHQEDPGRLGAVHQEQFTRQVNQAVEQGDRELLELMRTDQEGNAGNVEIIDAALAKLDEDE